MAKLLMALALSLAVAISAQGQYENSKIKKGMKAPELSYPGPDGTKVTLSEITKDRYVFLDFWASWCGPCRHANPRLVAMYKEYSGKKFKKAKKGFTIVSVSMDKNKEAWVKAIKDDNLGWPYHMSDLVDWNTGKCATANKYGVQYIPQGFLIGPDGRIVGKYGSAEEAEYDLKNLVKQ